MPIETHCTYLEEVHGMKKRGRPRGPARKPNGEHVAVGIRLPKDVLDEVDRRWKGPRAHYFLNLALADLGRHEEKIQPPPERPAQPVHEGLKGFEPLSDIDQAIVHLRSKRIPWLEIAAQLVPMGYHTKDGRPFLAVKVRDRAMKLAQNGRIPLELMEPLPTARGGRQVRRPKPAAQPAPPETAGREALLSELRTLLARAGVELPELEVPPNATS